MRRFILTVLGVTLAAGGALQAQRIASEGSAFPFTQGMPDAGVQGGFTFCRLWYDRGVSLPSGAGWSTDYPRADQNFVARLTQLTHVRATAWANGFPGHAAFRADDPQLFSCPFLMASDAGSMRLSDAEVAKLREYILKGGFLWVDDFWGEAWTYWHANLRRILPEYEFVELTPEHRLFRSFYVVRELPQIPSIRYWSASGGDSAEFGRENRPSMRAIMDASERILVLMTYNTDIADGWERETDSAEFFRLFSPPAYAVGMNVAIWMLTH